MRALGISACLLGMLAISACGGGGGGGGSDSSGRVQGSLALSPSTLTFETNNPAQTPSTQVVRATINTNATGTIYLRIVPTGLAVLGVSDIIVTSSMTGEGTVIPVPATVLGPGKYSGAVTVTACTSGPDCSSGIIGTPQTVSVSYTITGVTSTKPSLAYTLSLNPDAADYGQTMSVAAYPSYTATSDVDWLSVAPGSGGSGTAQVSLNLVKSTVDTFDSGDHTATVTLTAPSGNTLQLPVTLTIRKPQLEQVAPYVARANTAGTVTLRGSYLDLLPVNGIDFSLTAGGSGVAPSNLTVASPTELRVTHPALAAGSYFVRMHDAQGALIDRSTARLVVVEPANYASGTLAYPPDTRYRGIDALVYDAERRALLLVVSHLDRTASELMRFEYTSGWSSATVVPFPYLDTLALSADGRDLVAASSPDIAATEHAKVTLLSPTTLVERTSLQTDFSYSYFRGLAVLNTNDVLALESSHYSSGPGRPLRRYSIKKNSLVQMTYSNDIFSGFTDGSIVASGDGRRVVAASNAGSTANQSIYEYSASSSTNLMTSAPVAFDVRALRMDRSGDTLLIRGKDFSNVVDGFLRIYARDWTMRGSLPLSAIEYVLAPDGSRAYTYDNDGKVHVYDLTATPVAGVFPEVGVLTLAGSPGIANIPRMVITPDGHTLFIAGDAQVVIQSLP